jgi:RNA polymerase sigma factor (sigma-70 family)
MDTGQPGGSDLRRELELLHRESFGWALACCAHDVSTAETVLQTVYLKILEGKARFDGRARLKTWLFAVIRNTAAEERRHQILGRLRLFPVALLQDLPAPQEDVGRTLYCSEVRTLFRKALGGLPRRQREVLQLVFYHELSLAEAAVVMRISIGSARQHYERGKSRLRQVEALRVLHG